MATIITFRNKRVSGYYEVHQRVILELKQTLIKILDLFKGSKRIESVQRAGSINGYTPGETSGSLKEQLALLIYLFPDSATKLVVEGAFQCSCHYLQWQWFSGKFGDQT